jgi:PDZ domain
MDFLTITLSGCIDSSFFIFLCFQVFVYKMFVMLIYTGDVILSVNGVSMENADHQTLVNFIKSSGPTLR